MNRVKYLRADSHILYGFMLLIAMTFNSPLTADTEVIDEIPSAKNEIDGLSLFMSAEEQAAMEEKTSQSQTEETQDESVEEGVGRLKAESKQGRELKVIEENVSYNGVVLRGEAVLGVWVNAKRLSHDDATLYVKAKNTVSPNGLRLPLMPGNDGEEQ